MDCISKIDTLKSFTVSNVNVTKFQTKPKN